MRWEEKPGGMGSIRHEERAYDLWTLIWDLQGVFEGYIPTLLTRRSLHLRLAFKSWRFVASFHIASIARNVKIEDAKLFEMGIKSPRLSNQFALPVHPSH